MNKDCSIVRDLLPLYLEAMVSEDTAAYVQAHLAVCPECAAEYAAISQKSSLDPICPQDADTGIGALKSVRRKIKMRSVIIACAAVAVTLIFVLACTFMRPVTMDYGQSELYTQEEIASAMEKVQSHIGSWDGCKLYSISYAGDKNSQDELDYINGLAADGVTYADCMVLSVAFRSPLFGGGAWNANFLYHWSWYLGRTETGDWEAVTWGVG